MYRLFWIVPLFACVVWWGMLIALLTAWAIQGKPIYEFMDPDDNVVYISDVGATSLQPVFIACSATQAGLFMASLVFERYMRHKGRLLKNHRSLEKWLSCGAIVFGIFGQIGIILVSIYDTNNHHSVHVGCLILFIVGIAISAVLNSVEFTLLDRNYPDVNRLKVTYILRWIWIVISLGLAIAFAVCNKRRQYDVSAGFEWALSFFYGFYLLILSFDLIPFKRYQERNSLAAPPPVDMAENSSHPEFSSFKQGNHVMPQQDMFSDEASLGTIPEGMAPPPPAMTKPKPTAF